MTGKPDDISILHTTQADLPDILRLFEQAMAMQGLDGYKVWQSIDKTALEKDIENRLQYKIVKGGDILCIFSIQHSDPFIWREKDRNDAIYLHRIVTNPDFKGQKQFQKVLDWAQRFARANKLKFVRMDTWADNAKIIAYYTSFGFAFIENYQTTDAPELPVQNRNLNVALLELELDQDCEQE